MADFLHVRRIYGVCGASVFLAVAGCDSPTPNDGSAAGATEGTDDDGGPGSGPTTSPPTTDPTGTSPSTSGPTDDDDTTPPDDDAGSSTGEPGDACDALTCRNGGECVGDGVDGACDCDGTGYEGETCADDVDECDGDAPTCENGGACHNVDGGFVCDCSGSGFGGPTCASDLNECVAGFECANGGACVNTPGGALCDCDGTGYSGKGCTDDVDECAAHEDMCNNGGLCSNSEGSFECLCAKTGYSGATCSKDVDECAAGADCGFGSCSNSAGSYACDCGGSGYQGASCLDDIDECAADSVSCVTNSACVNTAGSVACACDEGLVADSGSCVSDSFLLLRESFEGGTAGRFDATIFDDGSDQYSTAFSAVTGTVSDDISVLDGADMWRFGDVSAATNPFWPSGDDCGDKEDGACSYILMERVFVDDYDAIFVAVSLQALAEDVYEADDFVDVEIAFDKDIAPDGDAGIVYGDYKSLGRFEGGYGGAPSRLTDSGTGVVEAPGKELSNVKAETVDGEKPPEAADFDYTFYTPATGDEASLRFTVGVGAGEDVGIDDVRVYGIRIGDGSVQPTVLGE